MELDIDQLSNEALLKLWELCKKVLPGFGKGSAAGSNSSPHVNATPAKQASKSASKPKKSKPMSAQEQEARIAQLRGLRDLYKPGQEPDMAGSISLSATQREDESSDESSSEEELVVGFVWRHICVPWSCFARKHCIGASAIVPWILGWPLQWSGLHLALALLPSFLLLLGVYVSHFLSFFLPKSQQTILVC